MLALTLGLISTNVYAQYRTKTFVLSWVDNSDNEDVFKVERATTTSGPWTEINAAIPANTTTYSDDVTGVEGSTFCYRVRASNSAGDSGYSNVACASIPYTVPAAPTGLGVLQ